MCFRILSSLVGYCGVDPESILERISVKGSGGSLWQAMGKVAETTVELLHSTLTSSTTVFGLVLIDSWGLHAQDQHSFTH